MALSPLAGAAAHADPTLQPDPGYPGNGSPCPYLNAPDSVCPNKMPTGGHGGPMPAMPQGPPPLQAAPPPGAPPSQAPIPPGPQFNGSCQSVNTVMTHGEYLGCCGDSKLIGIGGAGCP